YMFRDASSFNQSLAAWQMESFVGGVGLFQRSGMSCENFSYSLYSWATNPNTNDGAILDGSGVTYSPDIAPYVDKLREERNWTFQLLEEGTCSVILPDPPIGPDDGNILYVDANVNTAASGYTGSGNSWANAIPQLADALNWAREQYDGGSPGWSETEPLQIWVASGTYSPASGESFEMVANVKIYGGFNGSEEGLSSRDWHTNATVLQGNGASVVRNPSSAALSRAARLDGFTITGGQSMEGDGIHNATDATFANLIVRGNIGIGSG